jgi:hypothetical protein
MDFGFSPMPYGRRSRIIPASGKLDDGAMSLRLTGIAVTLSLLATPCPAAAAQTDPMQFFEGRTESIGTVRLVMKKPFQSKAIGEGEIKPDGSLVLVQRVYDQGEQMRVRRWHMRRVGPGRYSGTMSEAKGPVTVEEIDGKYRFRFRMDGSVSVEQWLIPAPDGQSARSKITIRKYGIQVGSSNAVIHKVN